MRRTSLLFSFGWFLAWLLSSCVAQRDLPYLQNPALSTKTPVTAANQRPLYHLQPNDILAVQVQSAQPVLNELFNPASSATMFNAEAGTLFLSGYSVSPEGNITLPTVGAVKVGGLTLAEAQAQIQQQLTRYVRDASVQVKLSSFKVTLLGEVRNPGRYFLYNGQATVLEALGMAGDLNQLGNRHNVKLIRPQPDGGSQVVLLDLTDGNLLQSPYYYVQPNDVLYVEPLKAQASRGNAGNLGLVFSGITSLVVLLSFLNIKL